MDVESIKNFVGKKCRIVLKNDYNYTAIIPNFEGKSFTVTDKFGNRVTIDCDYVGTIQVISERGEW
jgi:hypothetical protein